MGVLKKAIEETLADMWAYKQSSLTQDPGLFNRAHRQSIATPGKRKRAISRAFTMRERRLKMGKTKIKPRLTPDRRFPMLKGRDNKDYYNTRGGASGGSCRMRVPSLKRSKRTWRNFYKLFPNAISNAIKKGDVYEKKDWRVHGGYERTKTIKFMKV